MQDRRRSYLRKDLVSLPKDLFTNYLRAVLTDNYQDLKYIVNLPHWYFLAIVLDLAAQDFAGDRAKILMKH